MALEKYLIDDEVTVVGNIVPIKVDAGIFVIITVDADSVVGVRVTIIVEVDANSVVENFIPVDIDSVVGIVVPITLD